MLAVDHFALWTISPVCDRTTFYNTMEYPYSKQEGHVTMSSYFEALRSIWDQVIYPAGYDILRSAPDALFLGTGLMALITQSFPLAIYVLAMLEFTIFHRVIGGFVGALQGNDAKPPSDLCTFGLPSPYQFSPLGELLVPNAFPSGVVFFMAASVIYSVASTLNFGKELEELGKQESEWNTRIPLSIMFGTLLLLAFLLFRVYQGCDGFLVAAGSTLIGLIIGFVVYLVHLYLFGRDSINFLGIPLLADRAANGKPLYVCARND